MSRRAPAAAFIASFTILVPTTFADGVDSPSKALSSGMPNLDVRLRYEEVQQQNIDDAEAFTVRARLGYTTAKWYDFDSQLEGSFVAHLGDDNYNSTSNNKASNAIVPDPDLDRLNQAWLRYSGLPLQTSIKLGRQRILYDNQRFVGNVGWRQTEQTYDGATLASAPLKGLSINYAFLTNINSFRYNSINGANTANIDLDHSQLANVSYHVADWLKLSGYGYLLNFSAPAPAPAYDKAIKNPRSDSKTFGGRAIGTLPLGAWTLDYALEYARQDLYQANQQQGGAHYYLAETSLAYAKRVSGTLGYEVLGGDNSYGFQTPLATLHAFQGWADQFLVTPPAGIDDFYVGLGGTLEKVNLKAVWHDFNPNNGATATHYGSELDLQATRPLFKGCVLGLKFAGYSADHAIQPGTSPTKADKSWAWIEYHF